MKKSDIAGGVADRIGLSRSAARNGVEAVFRSGRRGPGKWRRSTDNRIRNALDDEPAGPYRAQSVDRRELGHTVINGAGVQVWQGAQGSRK